MGFRQADCCLHTIATVTVVQDQHASRKPSQGSQWLKPGLGPHMQPHWLPVETSITYPTPKVTHTSSHGTYETCTF